MYPKRNTQAPGSADRTDESYSPMQVMARCLRDARTAGASHSKSTSLDMTAESTNWCAPDGQQGYPGGGWSPGQTLHTATTGTHYRTSSQFSSSNGRLPGDASASLSSYAAPAAPTPHAYPSDRSSPLQIPCPNAAITTTQLNAVVPAGSCGSMGSGGANSLSGTAATLPTGGGLQRSTTPVSDGLVQEKRYAHLFEEHRKVHQVVREKALEIERLAAEKKRLQSEADYYRVELAAQRRRFQKYVRAARSDVTRLVTLVSVLLPTDEGNEKTQARANSSENASGQRDKVKQLQTAYEEVQRRLAAAADQPSQPMVDGIVPESDRWLLDTLNLLSVDVLSEASMSLSDIQTDASTPTIVAAATAASVTDEAGLAAPPSGDVFAEHQSRPDAVQEACEGALRAVEGLAHYMSVLDFGFPATSLGSLSTSQMPLSIAVTVGGCAKESSHSRSGRPVVPVLQDLTTA